MRERGNGPPGARPRIVIIGAGYAGYHCARGLERRLPAAAADIMIVSPTDYMPYLSLLPEVGAGIVDPRHIAVSLSATLRRTLLVPGHAIGADLASRSVTVAGPDGERREVGWDRLVIAPGSVSRTLRLPGVLDHAKGFKNLAEALYLRDHLLAQMELADASDDPAQRRELCTFVVVGAGYTGTEVAAQGQLFTRAALRRHPRIRPDEVRWLLMDQAAAVLPELGRQLGRPALRILRRRGLDVRLETTIEEITGRWVRLSDGTTVPTRTVVWCVGAKVVTRGYHLYALPANRLRVATDWFNDIVEHRQFVRLGLVQPDRSGLAVAEATDIYYRTDGRPLGHGQPLDHGSGAPNP